MCKKQRAAAWKVNSKGQGRDVFIEEGKKCQLCRWAQNKEPTPPATRMPMPLLLVSPNLQECAVPGKRPSKSCVTLLVTLRSCSASQGPFESRVLYRCTCVTPLNSRNGHGVINQQDFNTIFKKDEKNFFKFQELNPFSSLSPCPCSKSDPTMNSELPWWLGR